MKELFDLAADMTRAYAASLRDREFPSIEDLQESKTIVEHKLQLAETEAEGHRRRLEIINQKIAERENERPPRS